MNIGGNPMPARTKEKPPIPDEKVMTLPKGNESVAQDINQQQSSNIGYAAQKKEKLHRQSKAVPRSDSEGFMSLYNQRQKKKEKERKKKRSKSEEKVYTWFLKKLKSLIGKKEKGK